MFLRPEHRGNFKDPFMNSDHHLLIKLRTLGKIGFFSKVVHTKDICSALRSGGTDLRSMDFRKSVLSEKDAKSIRNSVLDAENSPFLFIPQCHRTVVQKCRERSVHLFLIDHNLAYFIRF